ncbi:hypothetical protein [Magnetospirillum sp. SS-4]|uniref:hypothetical protein n=1 Tax=Magnetospirillum sp. SS-4 TaxID=2681465 RepID=UPI001382A0BF|nr:hypothetical protein [Magnetospirillum sp. SS-4]CAA7623012.1 hypothetical protein MTBSS4_40059 [Magnetospirillum sp. SS-4]
MDTNAWSEAFRLDVGAAAQDWFETSVFRIADMVLTTGERVDLAVSRYLADHRRDRFDDYLSPDLIICVAELVQGVQEATDDRTAARRFLRQAHGLWRGARSRHSSPISNGPTRIQACIGNIRNALRHSDVGINQKDE